MLSGGTYYLLLLHPNSQCFMPKKAINTKTKNSKPRKKTGKKVNYVKSFVQFLKGEKFRKIAGLFLVLFSLVLFFAFTSYFFTWQADDYLKQGDKASNWIGAVGRALSRLFVERWFGLAAYVFVLLTFIVGIRLLMKVTLLPLWRTTRISILIMIWLSLTLGYIFGGSDGLSVLGGEFGSFYSAWLNGAIGRIGTGLLLLFLLLSFLILNFNISLSFLKRIKLPKPNFTRASKNKAATAPKEDIYNTVEYAVADDEANSNATDKENESNPVEQVIEPDPFDQGNSNSGPEEMIVLDPSIKKEERDNEEHDEIELTIEKVVEKDTFDENEENDTAKVVHHGLDEPYDPRADLPGYRFPEIKLLEEYGKGEISVQKEELERNKNRIVETLGNYSIQIQKIKATIGPTVTLYEIIPAPGVRISKIKNLEDDIALSLAALGIRIIAPIPGKGTIGIEVPNQNPDIVSMKSVLGSDKFQNSRYELPFGMGKTISNESFVADLTKMPHLLMAGATGQGKSVGLNAIIASLLYKKHPAELKFVMVDPKKVELTLYSKIERHFLAKLPDSEEAIITDTRKVVRTLNSLGIEMDNRYELLKDAQVRNIKEYNVKFNSRKLNPLHGHRYLPYIVLVIDEFADLIMTAGKEIEVPITRLAQLARAVGIHLIIATQRPSVNIITGSIKANFPARVAFRVISKIDSRTILDTGGADQLIGRGDMLLSTGSDLLRLQCAFIDTPEIGKVTEFIGAQRAYPDAFHLPDFQDEQSETVPEYNPSDRDELFEDAARIIVQTQQGSTSLLQRKLKLGYNRAGRIIDQLEAAGVVGPFEGSKAREVKVANEVALEQFLKDLEENI